MNEIEEIEEMANNECTCSVCKYVRSRNCKDKVVLDKHKYILANKCYSDATLKSWKKEDLIEQIRILEHNWASAEASLNNQANYLQDKVVSTKEEYARLRNLEINYEDTYKNYREYAIENTKLKEELAQARKETAREILATIKSYDGWNELQRLRDEIAEEYGVEVE